MRATHFFVFSFFFSTSVSGRQETSGNVFVFPLSEQCQAGRRRHSRTTQTVGRSKWEEKKKKSINSRSGRRMWPTNMHNVTKGPDWTFPEGRNQKTRCAGNDSSVVCSAPPRKKYKKHQLHKNTYKKCFLRLLSTPADCGGSVFNKLKMFSEQNRSSF